MALLKVALGHANANREQGRAGNPVSLDPCLWGRASVLMRTGLVGNGTAATSVASAPSKAYCRNCIANESAKGALRY
jgi:hypothetical protein